MVGVPIASINLYCFAPATLSPGLAVSEGGLSVLTTSTDQRLIKWRLEYDPSNEVCVGALPPASCLSLHSQEVGLGCTQRCRDM